MAKKTVLLFFLFTIHNTLLSQERDTIYYTTNWTKTTKDFAHFFRPLPLIKKDSLFQIKDYFIDGQLQMQGLSSNNIKGIFEGLVTWYNKNGSKQIERHYIKGKQEGRVKSYFEDGTLKSDGQVTNNIFSNGTFIYTCNCPFKVQKYENQSVTERMSYYKDTKTVAEKQLIKYFDQVQKSIYYDKKGNEIASINYTNRSGNYLELEAGTKIHFSYTDDFFVNTIIAKTTISSDNLIKKEITLNPKNDIITEGILDNGYPLEGTFLKKGALISYKNGERHGIIKCCLDNANITVEGEYKNRSKYNGSFFDVSKKTITSYKNGQLHGEKKVFDDNYNTIGLENYDNGILDGKRITQNRFSKKTHTAFFNKGSIEHGELFEAGDLSVYKNGKRIERTIYDYKTDNPKEFVSYDELNNITKMTSFKNGETYTLYYKNGSPFEGEQMQSFGLTTYKDGAYNGPFTVFDSKQTIKGNYANFKYEGDVLFINTKTQDTLICLFKDGKPIDGVDCFNGKIGYKAGRKHGLFAKNFNNSNYVFDSLSVYYNNGVKIDTIRYFEKRKPVTYGVSKNGKPYNGTFYNEIKRQNFEVYNQGVITKKENIDYYKNYRHQFLYDGGKLTNENVYYLDYKKDSLAYKLNYKDSKPYFGRVFKEDSISNYFSVTNYINGKKNGTQTFFKKPFKPFIKKLTYKNDVLNGLAQYQYINNKQNPTQGVYKNNKPIEGLFITEYRSYIKVAKYKKSKLKKKTFYTFSKYTDNSKIIDSIVYKNNKPYNGLELIFTNQKKLFGKRYKNGMLINTDMSPSLKPYSSYRTILHEPLRDSLTGGGNYKYVIQYANTKRKTGIISYYYQTEKYGSITFKNNTITAVDVENYNTFKSDKFKFHLYFNPEGKLLNEVNAGNFKAQFYVPTKIIGNKHDALGNLQRLQNNHTKITFTFFLNDKAYTTLEMRDNKPYQGIMFEPDGKNNTFKYGEFKNGKRIVFLTKLTEAELLEKLRIK